TVSRDCPDPVPPSTRRGALGSTSTDSRRPRMDSRTPMGTWPASPFCCQSRTLMPLPLVMTDATAVQTWVWGLMVAIMSPSWCLPSYVFDYTLISQEHQTTRRGAPNDETTNRGQAPDRGQGSD